jgi:hypothetical protein
LIKEEKTEAKAYRDRAKERRDEFEIGPLSSEINNQNAANVNLPIEESNIGRKMLNKMGWHQGKGLGKAEQGVIEPVGLANLK